MFYLVLSFFFFATSFCEKLPHTSRVDRGKLVGNLFISSDLIFELIHDSFFSCLFSGMIDGSFRVLGMFPQKSIFVLVTGNEVCKIDANSNLTTRQNLHVICLRLPSEEFQQLCIFSRFRQCKNIEPNMSRHQTLE